MNNDILHILFGFGYVNRIPHCSTRFLRMTIFPVEIDIGLTSFTFTYVFETSVEVNILIGLGQEIDIMNTLIQTVQHVLLVHHDLLFSGAQYIICIAGTVSRQFERHLNGNVRCFCTFITIGKLRLILGCVTHLSY